MYIQRYSVHHQRSLCSGRGGTQNPSEGQFWVCVGREYPGGVRECVHSEFSNNVLSDLVQTGTTHHSDECGDFCIISLRRIWGSHIALSGP